MILQIFLASFLLFNASGKHIKEPKRNERKELTTINQDCPFGMVKQLVCHDSDQPTCQDPAFNNLSCKKWAYQCRCLPPPYGHIRHLNHCYKNSECPKPHKDGFSDKKTGHGFAIAGEVDDMNQIYVSHISVLLLNPHWYHVVALFEFTDAECAAEVRDIQAANPGVAFLLFWLVPVKLMNLIQENNKFQPILVTKDDPTTPVHAPCEVQVKKVLDTRRFDASQHAPKRLQNGDGRYFIFGNSEHVYMTHIANKCKDFQEMVELRRDSPHHKIPFTLNDLNNGVQVFKLENWDDKEENYYRFAAFGLKHSFTVIVDKLIINDKEFININC